MKDFRMKILKKRKLFHIIPNTLNTLKKYRKKPYHPFCPTIIQINNQLIFYLSQNRITSVQTTFTIVSKSLEHVQVDLRRVPTITCQPLGRRRLINHLSSIYWYLTLWWWSTLDVYSSNRLPTNSKTIFDAFYHLFTLSLGIFRGSVISIFFHPKNNNISTYETMRLVKK